MSETISAENSDSIRNDPFIQGLLKRMPENSGAPFSAEQLLALKIALSGRRWGRHAVDIRGSLGLWRWKYYYVLVCGREQRSLTRREQAFARLANLLALVAFFIVSTLLGILVLYLLKSALGIDLIPGYSFGVWGWFKQNVF